MPQDTPDWQRPSAQRLKLYPDGTPAVSMGPNLPSFVATHNASTLKTFTLSGNATNLRIFVSDSVTGLAVNYLLTIKGHGNPTFYSPGLVIPKFLTGGRPYDIRVSPDVDGQVDITIGLNPYSPANDCNVYVSELFGAETTVIASGSTSQVISAPKSYDWQVSAAFAAAGTPSLTMPAQGQVVMSAAYISASVLCTGGVSSTPQVQVVNGGASVLWQEWLSAFSTAAVAAKDAINLAPIALNTIVFNDTLTLQWDRALAAGVFSTLSMGGYLL